MKKFFTVLIVFSIFWSCKKDGDGRIQSINEIKACGVNDPLNNLNWLYNIVVKSSTDNSGNYLGDIWIVSYEGNDFIITDMALGSGGVMYHIFDCSGNPLNKLAEYEEILNELSDKILLFSNKPINK
jgi:hypothetical protein